MKQIKGTIFVIALLSLNFAPVNGSEEGDFPLNLLFSREDVPRIRENTQLPLLKDYWESLLAADFEKDRNFCREAFIYAVTGDEIRGQNAREGMLETLERKRWGMFVDGQGKTLGMLMAGRLTAWMALSYDWIYGLLSPEEREEVLNQIAEKGCVPCYHSLYGMRYPETAEGWQYDPEQPKRITVPDMSRWPYILGRNNFRAVVSGGLALGLFAIEGRDERFDEWKDMLLDSIHRTAELYEADGSYDEGMTYCNFATTYNVYFMEVMKRKLGIDFFDLINFTGMADCNLALFYPYNLEPAGSINFGDKGWSMDSSNLFWIAGKSRDGLAQYQALNHTDIHDLFSFVHYDPSVVPVAPDESSWFRQLDIGWITTRSGYGIDDLVVAMRSGPPANHEHADRNSVILKYGGEVLLADAKHPTYDPTSPGWKLRTSPGHNTIVIDGAGQHYHNGEEGVNESKSSAEIVRAGQRPGYEFWASDATPAYSVVNPDVTCVTRTVLVFREIPFVVIVDKVTKSGNPSRIAARWFVENRDREAEIETTARSFVLKRPDAKFAGVYAANQDLQITESEFLNDDSVGVFPHVDARTSTRTTDAFFVLAGCPVKAAQEVPEVTINREGVTYHVEVSTDSHHLKLNIHDRGRLPEWEILEQR